MRLRNRTRVGGSATLGRRIAPRARRVSAMPNRQNRVWLRRALTRPSLTPAGRRRLQAALRRSMTLARRRPAPRVF